MKELLNQFGKQNVQKIKKNEKGKKNTVEKERKTK